MGNNTVARFRSEQCFDHDELLTLEFGKSVHPGVYI